MNERRKRAMADGLGAHNRKAGASARGKALRARYARRSTATTLRRLVEGRTIGQTGRER